MCLSSHQQHLWFMSLFCLTPYNPEDKVTQHVRKAKGRFKCKLQSLSHEVVVWFRMVCIFSISLLITSILSEALKPPTDLVLCYFPSALGCSSSTGSTGPWLASTGPQPFPVLPSALYLADSGSLAALCLLPAVGNNTFNWILLYWWILFLMNNSIKKVLVLDLSFQ